MPYSDKMQIPPVVFYGLDTHSNEVFGNQTGAAYVRNMDFRPVGGMKKRAGLTEITIDGSRNSPVGTVDSVDTVMALHKQDAGDAFLVAVRGAVPSRTELDTTGWVELHARMEAGAVWVGQVGPFTEFDPTTSANYKGECLYMVNGEDEPFIITGDTAQTYEETISNTSIASTGIGTAITVTLSSAPAGAALANGDWVVITGAAGVLGTVLNNVPFRIEVISTTSFYLLESDGSRYLAPNAGAVSPAGSTNLRPQAIRRWPKLNYNATVANQITGYPDRWEDPDAAGGSTWPAGGDPDWPAGICLVGEGAYQRMFAYGFDKDPDRLDFSELGVPWHFGYADYEGVVTSAGEDGGFLYVNRGDGDRIIGVREFLGYTVVFKQQRIYIYSGSPGDGWALVRTLDTGAVSDRSIIQVGNQLMYWSMSGPRALSATEAYGDLATSGLAYICHEEVKKVTESAVRKIFAFHDYDNERVLWFAPYDGSTSTDMVFAHYYASPDAPDRWSQFDGEYAEVNAMAEIGPPLAQTRRVYAASRHHHVYLANAGTTDGIEGYTVAYDGGSGTPFTVGETVSWAPSAGTGIVKTHFGDGTDGFLYIEWVTGEPPEDNAAVTGATSGNSALFNGAPTITYYNIVAEYRTRWLDLGGVDWTKRVLNMNIVIGDAGAGRMKMYYAWDYDSNWTETTEAVRSRGAEGAYWGSAVWDSFTWGVTGRTMRRHAISDLGSLFRLRIYDDSQFGLQVHGLSLDVRVKGDRG